MGWWRCSRRCDCREQVSKDDGERRCDDSTNFVANIAEIVEILTINSEILAVNIEILAINPQIFEVNPQILGVNPEILAGRLVAPARHLSIVSGVSCSDLGRALRAKKRRESMAYGVVHFFPGGTKEQYEASLAAVHPDRNSLPKGQIYHAAGPSAGGWTIVAIHDSKASWESFRDNTLLPQLQAGVEGGFANPPQEQAFEAYNLQK